MVFASAFSAPQIVPNVGSMAVYENYTETFDLSLLPSDTKDGASIYDNVVPAAAAGFHPDQPPFLTSDYIQAIATELLDTPPLLATVKTEKSWDIGSPLGFSYLEQTRFEQDDLLTVLPPSPTPSTQDVNRFNPSPITIKQEYSLLPLSPPDSSGVPSPCGEPIKMEALDCPPQSLSESIKGQDHQLLREYLQDTTFQKKHNIKPLALESLFGGWSARNDIEPVISMALEQARQDVEATCSALNIPTDPQKWSRNQVQLWLQRCVDQFKLPPLLNMELVFVENGLEFYNLPEQEFIRRAPQIGGTLYAQLEVWKAACMEMMTSTLSSAASPPYPQASPPSWSSVIDVADVDMASDDDEELSLNSPESSSGSEGHFPVTPTPKSGRQSGSHIHLWQFLKELLSNPQDHGAAIRWLDRNKGVFKIEDSVMVAGLWGKRKNRPAMNYDKLSRSIRQYYKKGIMKKTERSQRLVYQFCHPYCL